MNRATVTTTGGPVLKSRRRPGVKTTVVEVGPVRFGDGAYPVVAGPVAVETEEQIIAAAEVVAAAGGAVLRAATHLAAATPYGFQGLGHEGLLLLEHAGRSVGLPIATEIVEPRHAEQVAEHVDLVEVGPQNMQNFSLLRAVGSLDRPVLLHRGPSATIDEWLMAAEYVLAEGNERILLCERGSRGFDPRTTDTVDISAVPVVQRLSHLPVVVDPTPAHGSPDLVRPLAHAVRAAGADGLVLTVHPDPPASRAGNGTQLDPAGFEQVMTSLGIPALRDEIDRIDRQLLELIARRLRRAVEIAHLKVARRLDLRSPAREEELLADARAGAVRLGLDPGFVEELMTLILRSSREAQRRAVGR